MRYRPRTLLSPALLALAIAWPLTVVTAQAPRVPTEEELAHHRQRWERALDTHIDHGSHAAAFGLEGTTSSSLAQLTATVVSSTMFAARLANQGIRGGDVAIEVVEITEGDPTAENLTISDHQQLSPVADLEFRKLGRLLDTPLPDRAQVGAAAFTKAVADRVETICKRFRDFQEMDLAQPAPYPLPEAGDPVAAIDRRYEEDLMERVQEALESSKAGDSRAEGGSPFHADDLRIAGEILDEALRRRLGVQPPSLEAARAALANARKALAAMPETDITVAGPTIVHAALRVLHNYRADLDAASTALQRRLAKTPTTLSILRVVAGVADDTSELEDLAKEAPHRFGFPRAGGVSEARLADRAEQIWADYLPLYREDLESARPTEQPFEIEHPLHGALVRQRDAAEARLEALKGLIDDMKRAVRTPTEARQRYRARKLAERRARDAELAVIAAALR